MRLPAQRAGDMEEDLRAFVFVIPKVRMSNTFFKMISSAQGQHD